MPFRALSVLSLCDRKPRAALNTVMSLIATADEKKAMDLQTALPMQKQAVKGRTIMYEQEYKPCERQRAQAVMGTAGLTPGLSF